MGEANRRKAARGQIQDYFVPVHNCPNCGALLDGMTSTTPGRSPHKVPKSQGMICICIKCHHIFINEKGKARELNDEEIVQIAGDPHLVKIMNIAGKAKALYERRMKEKKDGNI